MAEKSMFWNQPTDYTAQEFAKFFAPFLTNGVYVSSGTMGLGVSMSGLTATVAAGRALMRGYYYENDASPALTFTLSAAPTVAGIDRIDRIVLRLDTVAETLVAVLKKGTESSSPQPPALTNSATVLEMSLAQIRIKTNATTGTVTDERKPVSSLIEIPFTDMMAANEAEFNLWMDGIQEVLDENVAANLLNLIENNQADIQTLDTSKMNNSRITVSASNAVLSQMADGDIWIKYE